MCRSGFEVKRNNNNNNNSNNNNNNKEVQLGFHPVIDYVTYIHNMKLVTNEFNSGGLHEKHVVATWNFGNQLSICI